MIISRWFAAVLLVLSGMSTANAAFVFNITEVGANVVASGSGSAKLNELLFGNTGSNVSYVNPFGAVLVLGTANKDYIFWTGLNGPAFFGTNGMTEADTSSGDAVGIAGGVGGILLPNDYTSGDLLSAIGQWNNTNFATLGLTPGTYTYTWGEGAYADSLIVNVGGSSVPEPSTLALAGIGAGVCGVIKWRRRKKSVQPAA